MACPGLPVATPLTRRLLLAALTVGAKFLDDRFLSNAYYARVGGVTLRELNAMEAELLRRLGWRATVRCEACVLGPPGGAAGHGATRRNAGGPQLAVPNTTSPLVEECREEDVLQIMAILEMDGSLTDNPFGVGSGSDEEGRAAADAEAREL